MTHAERLARIVAELERKGFTGRVVIVPPPQPAPKLSWWRELLDILLH